MSIIFHCKFLYSWVKNTFLKRSMTLGLLFACVANNDTSHDENHAIKVLKKAQEYISYSQHDNKSQNNLLYYSALFHDSYDHKFKFSNIKKTYLKRHI